MTAYYNENKPEAAHMLRQLIRDGLVAKGDVDERSITEVKPDDLIGYTQCHFFAGIGGWSVALRLAGWQDNTPVWTGSCPCQPFSVAGGKQAQADERHLFPSWFDLIKECKPTKIFGEQVAAAIAHGWWDDVVDVLERENYACGAVVLPACSIGSPHRRDRLYFNAQLVDDPDFNVWAESAQLRSSSQTSIERTERQDIAIVPSGTSRPDSMQSLSGHTSVVGDTNDTRPQGREFYAERSSEQPFRADGMEWYRCGDGKLRQVKRGLRVLANGEQFRVPLLHALGNQIVPQVAAQFITASKGFNQ